MIFSGGNVLDVPGWVQTSFLPAGRRGTELKVTAILNEFYHCTRSAVSGILMYLPREKYRMMEQGIRSGEREWRPDIRLKSLYRIYLLLIVWVGILTWLVPLVFLIPALWSLIVTVPLFFGVILASLWITWYYQTLAYTFTNDGIVWRKGVWFRQTGIVPYNRITNIDLIQGPIMRRVGVSTLRIKTAGYSAPSGASSGIRIEGADQPGELRELILGFVRGPRPVAVEARAGEDDSSWQWIQGELVRTRTLPEEKRKK
jgi:membrane protein YdbS with pleckstrin-like domain